MAAADQDNHLFPSGALLGTSRHFTFRTGRTSPPRTGACPQGYFRWGPQSVRPTYISLSLSLSLYIYIYISPTQRPAPTTRDLFCQLKTTARPHRGFFCQLKTTARSHRKGPRPPPPPPLPWHLAQRGGDGFGQNSRLRPNKEGAPAQSSGSRTAKGP